MSRLDEFTLIAQLRQELGGGRGGAGGIGDDAVRLRAADGRIVATDTMVEGVHFRRDWSTAQQVGWKLLATNLSDIWAMGAEPKVWLLNLTLDGDNDWAAGLFAGFVAARDALCPGLALVGGDTTATSAGVVLSATVLGALRPGATLLTRAGARPGQRLWIDGPVGLAAAGLALLQAGVQDATADRPWGPAFVAAAAACLRQHRRPTPPAAILGGRTHGATACIDISDGLAADLWHMACASDVHLRLHPELPGGAVLAAASQFLQQEVGDWQRHGGDDYVRVVASQQRPGPRWQHIGDVVGRGAALTQVGADGRPEALNPHGYRHTFGTRAGAVAAGATTASQPAIP